ncbi:MAG: YceI family protein [Candidatus Pacebacteria bacterium]|nr:YceI family protein [Candidatus Paceibacterota bacterium]
MKKLLVVVLLAIVVGGLYFLNSKNESPKDLNTNDSVSTDTNDNMLDVVSLESKATYEIDEVLNGVPTHVVGTSSSLSGKVIFNKESKKIEGGEIVLDANSFKTDKSLRDENVKKMVLKTSEAGNDAITFSITKFEGAPESKTGEEVSVKVLGDLKISGVTKAVTFDGKAKMGEDGTLTVNASTTLTYEDFGIAVPDLPFLKDVSKNVKLSVDIVAK